MKKIILVSIVLFGLKCNTQENFLIGKWATVINSNEYYEFHIDSNNIKIIDGSGTQSQSYGYEYNEKHLFTPYDTFKISYITDKCNLKFKSNLDSFTLEKIYYDENIVSFNSFYFRKYNMLISRGIISSDSAINFFWEYKNDTTEYDVIEE